MLITNSNSIIKYRLVGNTLDALIYTLTNTNTNNNSYSYSNNKNSNTNSNSNNSNTNGIILTTDS